MKNDRLYLFITIFTIVSSSYHLSHAKGLVSINIRDELVNKSLRGLKIRNLDYVMPHDKDINRKVAPNITDIPTEKVDIMEDINEDSTSKTISNTTHATPETETSNEDDINEPTIQERFRKQAQKAKNKFYDLSRSSPTKWTSDQWGFFAGVLITALTLISCCCGFCIRCRK